MIKNVLLLLFIPLISNWNIQNLASEMDIWRKVLSTSVNVSCVNAQVTEQLDTTVLAWWMPACFQCQSLSPALGWHLQRAMHTVTLWWQVVYCCHSKLWNGLPAQLCDCEPNIKLWQFKWLLKRHFCFAAVAFCDFVLARVWIILCTSYVLDFWGILLLLVCMS